MFIFYNVLYSMYLNRDCKVKIDQTKAVKKFNNFRDLYIDRNDFKNHNH